MSCGVRVSVFLGLGLLFLWEPSVAQVTKSPSIFHLPPDPIPFQQGPGSAIASSYCLICHSAEYIYMQPPLQEKEWAEIVKKMKQAFGCPIPDEEIPPLVNYLVSQNDLEPRLSLRIVQLDHAQDHSGSTKEQGGDAQKGRRVFGAYCANCHGKGGKGDGPIGQSLVPPAANLTVLGKKSDKEILDTIRNGRPGTAMPSWIHDLSAQDILDVLAYLRSLGS